jgi:hypothetical protein
VFIRFNGAEQGVVVEVCDAMGRMVDRPVLRANKPIGVSGLAPGIYVLRVFEAGGRVLGQERMIIQR